MILINFSQYPSIIDFIESLASPVAFLEFAFGFVIFGILGTVAVGWITIPIAAITGYALGREYENRNVSEK